MRTLSRVTTLAVAVALVALPVLTRLDHRSNPESIFIQSDALSRIDVERVDEPGEPPHLRMRTAGINGATSTSGIPNRGGDNRRQSGKLTVTRALNEDEGARARSLAALKRAREKEKRSHKVSSVCGPCSLRICNSRRSHAVPSRDRSPDITMSVLLSSNPFMNGSKAYEAFRKVLLPHE